MYTSLHLATFYLQAAASMKLSVVKGIQSPDFGLVHVPHKAREPLDSFNMSSNGLSLIDSVNTTETFLTSDPTRSEAEDVLGQGPVVSGV